MASTQDPNLQNMKYMSVWLSVVDQYELIYKSQLDGFDDKSLFRESLIGLFGCEVNVESMKSVLKSDPSTTTIAKYIFHKSGNSVSGWNSSWLSGGLPRIIEDMKKSLNRKRKKRQD